MKIFDLQPKQVVRRRFTLEFTVEQNELLDQFDEIIKKAGGQSQLEPAMADFVVRQVKSSLKEISKAMAPSTGFHKSNSIDESPA